MLDYISDWNEFQFAFDGDVKKYLGDVKKYLGEEEKIY